MTEYTTDRRTTIVTFDVAADTSLASSDASADTTYSVAYSVIKPASPSAASSPSAELPVLIFSHPFNNERSYWKYQIEDPLLVPYTKIVLDAIGFGASTTFGRPWSFGLAAQSILTILSDLESQGVIGNAGVVVVGDSMGGGPTGLRCALKDQERVRKENGGKARVLGVVACGTSVEEESADLVEEYTEGAHDFARQCLDPIIGVEAAITTLASNMCLAGYTSSPSEPYASARSYGQSVIESSLRQALKNKEGDLEPKRAGEIMVQNYGILNERRSLIPLLAVRPSRLGKVQVLVVHGTEEAAYPFDRDYHGRSASAIGKDNAETYVVQGGPHFVTATHWEEVDKVIDEWIRRKVMQK